MSKLFTLRWDETALPPLPLRRAGAAETASRYDEIAGPGASEPATMPPKAPAPTHPNAPASTRAYPAAEPARTGRLPRDTRRAVIIELVIVFAITLGMSGLRSLVSMIETQIKANEQQISLGQLQVSVAAPQSNVGTIDLIRQLLSITQGFAWGLLGLYLLWRAGASLKQHLGLDFRHTGRDLASAVGLAALIGIPGLALYLAAHAMGLSLTVAVSTMTDVWWRAPVSVLIAFQNGFLEEALVVGYLLLRLRQLELAPWLAVGISAVLRGSYHLYQGYGGFVGNVAMGIVFAFVFLRWRRLWPLVYAHGLIDTVAIVGYPLLHGHVSWLP